MGWKGAVAVSAAIAVCLAAVPQRAFLRKCVSIFSLAKHCASKRLGAVDGERRSNTCETAGGKDRQRHNVPVLEPVAVSKSAGQDRQRYMSAQMARRPLQLPFRLVSKSGIQIFERPEKSHKGIFQIRRTPPGLVEIVAPELILVRDHRRSHGAILVRALRPCEADGGVNPECEAHRNQYSMTSAQTNRSSRKLKMVR